MDGTGDSFVSATGPEPAPRPARSAASGGGQIQVQTTAGLVLTVEVMESDTIHAIKEKIWDALGIPPAEQRLICVGRPIADDTRLTEFEHEGHLHLVVRKGGSSPPVAGEAMSGDPMGELTTPLAREAPQTRRLRELHLVLTGAPAGGKSTLLPRLQRLLEAAGFRVVVVPEAATAYFMSRGRGGKPLDLSS
jgi:hypothetical protein